MTIALALSALLNVALLLAWLNAAAGCRFWRRAWENADTTHRRQLSALDAGLTVAETAARLQLERDRRERERTWN